MCKCTPNLRTPFCGKPDCGWPGEPEKTVPWTDKMVERHCRDLADENERLRQQLREADEQCHQQVAAAVKDRDEALREPQKVTESMTREFIRLRREEKRLKEENDELRSYCDLYGAQVRELQSELKTMRAAVVVLESERNEARRAIWELMNYYASSVAWSEVCELFPQYPWLERC